MPLNRMIRRGRSRRSVPCPALRQAQDDRDCSEKKLMPRISARSAEYRQANTRKYRSTMKDKPYLNFIDDEVFKDVAKHQVWRFMKY